MRPCVFLLCTALGLVPAVQAAPLGEPPPLDPRDDRVQRKAIRGGPVDVSQESPELRELREFEQATFPRPGMRSAEREPTGEPEETSSPTAGLGPDAVPEALRSPETRRLEDRTQRPPLPWLASLKLLDHLGLSATFVRFEARVIRYLEFYKEEKRGRSIMASWLRKQGRYRALIEEVLDRYQLPRFLLYVCMIESGYDPHDRSRAGAVGLWQFMPEGARIYGLRVDYWVDERKDPVRSTEAAARYLGDLKTRFGSWHLALAAFNAGYGAVLRAMQKYNTNDYWELCRHEDGLPWETLLYVPKVIATALVGENRALFGYENVQPDAPLVFDRVQVSTTVSLRAAAQAVGVPVEELERLNPELRRGRTPPLRPGETWSLKLPQGTVPKFLARFDPRSERLESYIVRFGERLDDIARARGVSVRELRRLNGVEDASEIRAGVTLLVPPLPRGAPRDPPPGEEVVIVAVPDKSLVVPGRKRVFYRVIPGDTISTIARFFRVSQAELQRWNNLDLDATLATGMVLDVWVDKDFDTSGVQLVDPERVRVVTTGSDEFFDLVETLRGRRRLVYLCRAGDTLHKIAKRYGLTVADLERINRLSQQSVLRPGQPITVYVKMTESERAEAMRRLLSRDPATPVTVTPIEDGEEEEAQLRPPPRGLVRLREGDPVPDEDQGRSRARPPDRSQPQQIARPEPLPRPELPGEAEEAAAHRD
ncbi:MAG: LysM peptidoglycan-binding domain-containing protein [Myxococcales bacterium]|nr:LysM peptidoglycan-binding domain-containing protein [Myxococcota bacterium]MDW8282781.1 LysM peptidoglycan-binding domain-containing protein [Myxococcales bacterium]